MEKELLDAIRKLNDTIVDLSRSLGRGVGSTGGVNRGGGIEDAITGSAVLSKTMKKLSVIQQAEYNQIVKTISMNQKLTAGQAKFLKEINVSEKEIKNFAAATQDAADAQEKAAKKQKEATEDLIGSFGSFGAGLLDGSKDLGSAVGSLGYSLKRQAEWAEKNNLASAGMVTMLARLAGAIAFTLTSMKRFAENAQEMSGMVDLARVRVGFLTEARLFSSLDKSFVKVINDSQGAFRVFGANTEEAIDNLSNLSRGLRLGSSAARSSTAAMAKDFDRAASATAALGLTQDEQAAMQAAIMTQVRLRAKNDREAQQMLVKQYADTATSARNLSNQFGLSAKDVAKSMQDFMTSTSGQIAALKGVKGAAEVKEMLKLAVPGLSEDLANRMAIDIARGKVGAAVAAGPPEAANMIQIVGQAAMQAQAAGGITDKTLTEAMRGQRGAIQAEFDRFSDLAAGLNDRLFDVSAGAGNLGARLDETAKQRQEREKKAGVTEADNVKTMSTLSTAMDALRGSINMLTGAILGMGLVLGPVLLTLTGMLAQIAAGKLFGAITGGAGAAATAGTAATGILGSIKGVFANTILPAVSKGFTTVFGVISSTFSTYVLPVLSRFSQGMLSFVEKVLPGFASWFGQIGQGLSTVAGKILPRFASGLSGIIGKLGGLGGVLGTLAMVAAGGAIVDTVAGALGVGGKEINEKQDEANWERMSLFQKMQSGLARSIETLGSALFMGNMANEARAKRIQSETEFLEKTSRLSPTTNFSVPPAVQADLDKFNFDRYADLPSTMMKGQESRADMGQIMNYLSSISSDIAAIRSNTRGESATTPVRLG